MSNNTIYNIVITAIFTPLTIAYVYYSLKEAKMLLKKLNDARNGAQRNSNAETVRRTLERFDD